MAELTLVLKEGNTETLVLVTKDVFTIGRLSECDLFLPFGGVSRNHARIQKVADNWNIEDLGSKNGTQINKILITNSHELNDGDIISLGNISLLVILASIEPPSDSFLQPIGADGEQKTILRNVKQLQEQWIEARGINGNDSNKDKIIARLKDLVDIAKNLSAAASIEEIFSQVQQVIFRYLNSIDRLALLIDVNASGN
jgi:adenylate cyclase